MIKAVILVGSSDLSWKYYFRPFLHVVDTFIHYANLVISRAQALANESCSKKSSLYFKSNITHRMAWKTFVHFSRLCIIQRRTYNLATGSYILPKVNWNEQLSVSVRILLIKFYMPLESWCFWQKELESLFFVRFLFRDVNYGLVFNCLAYNKIKNEHWRAGKHVVVGRGFNHLPFSIPTLCFSKQAHAFFLLVVVGGCCCIKKVTLGGGYLSETRARGARGFSSFPTPLALLAFRLHPSRRVDFLFI